MPNALRPKARRIGLETKEDVLECCRILGLSCDVSHVGYRWKIEVTYGGEPVLSHGWHRYDLDYTLSCDGLNPNFLVADIRHTIERSRWLVAKKRYIIKVPFGVKTVTEELKLDVPDFSTTAELEIKVACQPEEGKLQ